MAELFNLIRQGRFNEFLRRYLQADGAKQLSPELGAYLCLEADRPEWEYLKGTRLCMGNLLLAGDATHAAVLGILNPTGSNLLVVVTSILVSLSATGFVALQLDVQDTTDTLTTPRAKIVRETRYSGTGSQAANLPQAKCLGDILLAPDGSAVHRVAALANTEVSMLGEEPIVLGPNQGLEVVGPIAATTLNATVFWTERVMADTER